MTIGKEIPKENVHFACHMGMVATLQALLAFGVNLHHRLVYEFLAKLGSPFTDELTPLELMQAMRVKKWNFDEDRRLVAYMLKVYHPIRDTKCYFGEAHRLIEYMLKVCDPICEFPPWPDNLPNDYIIYKIPDPPPDFTRPLLAQAVDGARVLCIDGGGTRGFVPIEILDQIEKCFPEGKRKITDYFDWIVGTSTGGLIALYLSLGYSAADCRKMYFKLKDEIFAGSRPYDVSILERQLKTAFGEDRKMCDIPTDRIRCVIIASTITGSMKKNAKPQSVLFTNYCPETSGRHIWEVARCTSAAPYIFNPYKDPQTGVLYYDGGLVANNPTLLGLNEVTRVTGRKSLKNGFVLSLGTGKAPETEKQSESVDLTVSSWRSWVANLRPLFRTLIKQVTKSDGEVVQTAENMCLLAECCYLRLSPTLLEPIELDETDNMKLVNMIYHAKAFGNIYRERIKEICQNLARDGGGQPVTPANRSLRLPPALLKKLMKKGTNVCAYFDSWILHG